MIYLALVQFGFTNIFLHMYAAHECQWTFLRVGLFLKVNVCVDTISKKTDTVHVGEIPM